jgi:hypothetical protein
MDNGWDSDTAVKNIKHVAARLGIDYQSYVLDWDEFKDLQLSFLKASVVEIETPTDMAIPATLHRVAAENRVKFIISGGNYATEGILPKSWHYDAKDVRYLKAIHGRFGTRRLSSFPTFGYWSEAYFKLIKGIRSVYVLNHVSYSKAEAVKCLENELGWKNYGGKHHESRITAFVHSYVLPVKFSIDYRRATLSTQICAGQVSREDALEQLRLSPFDPATIDGDKEYIAKKFEITRGELERILALPPRSYRDYPNNQHFLEALYRTYRRFFSTHRPADRLGVRPPGSSIESNSGLSALGRSGGSEHVSALILAYDFPPRVSVGGLRPYSWYRYLKQFGVAPTIVTRQWSNHHGSGLDYVAPSDSKEIVVEASQFGTILRAPYEPNLSNRLLLRSRTRFRWIRRAITAWYDVGQYMLPIGPRRQVFLTARSYLRQHGADVIVATGEPFVLFRYASQLSKEFGIPWIADYRDPWTHDRARLPWRVSRTLNAMLEAKCTASSSAITTVSEFCGGLIATLIKGRPIHVVPNGYDPGAVSRARGIEQGSEKLTIAFVGTIYDGYPLENVLSACNQFLVRTRDARFELRFVGIDRQDEVETMVGSRYPALIPSVTFFKRAPNAEVIETLASANAFLLFNNFAYVGTKIYDYLGLRRRILLCFSDDTQTRKLRRQFYDLDEAGIMNRRVQEDMIRATESGVIIRDEEHLVDTLSGLYREFLESRRIACNSVGTEAYSRESHARRMAEIMRGVSGLRQA